MSVSLLQLIALIIVIFHLQQLPIASSAACDRYGSTTDQYLLELKKGFIVAKSSLVRDILLVYYCHDY